MTRRAKHRIAVALVGSLSGTLILVAARSQEVTGAVAADSGSPLPRDLSPWSMFISADVVVKAVIVGLALASMVTWTLWIAKGLEMAAAKRRAAEDIRILEDASTLDRARLAFVGGRVARGPLATMMEAAAREAKRSADLSAEGVKERLAIALSRIEARAGRDMARGTGVLATIGAIAPFVGLFGTVWGIMNSFIGISRSHTTNLAVVAPGIAEALLATAIGLAAAIPAVIVYNVFARGVAGYRGQLADLSAAVLQHASRDLDRGEPYRGAGDVSSAPPAARREVSPRARAAE